MELPKRKHMRLINYDYSQNGAYFITICTHDRVNLFGTVVGDGSPVPIVSTKLNIIGCTIENYINLISCKYESVKIDKYVIMPNHIHMLLAIENGTGNPSPTIGNIIGWFKYQTTKQINIILNNHSEDVGSAPTMTTLSETNPNTKNFGSTSTPTHQNGKMINIIREKRSPKVLLQ